MSVTNLVDSIRFAEHTLAASRWRGNQGETGEDVEHRYLRRDCKPLSFHSENVFDCRCNVCQIS